METQSSVRVLETSVGLTQAERKAVRNDHEYMEQMRSRLSVVRGEFERLLSKIPEFQNCLNVLETCVLGEALDNAVFHGNLQMSSEVRENPARVIPLLESQYNPSFYGRRVVLCVDLQTDACIQLPELTRVTDTLTGKNENTGVEKLLAQCHLSIAETLPQVPFNGIVMLIQDEGVGFDPSTVPDPREDANLLKAHGRGLLLIHTYSDRVEFNERGNSIKIVKQLGQ